MEFKDILISVLLSSLVKGQGLLSIKPEVFIEGQPGNVTCTYNNQPRTFIITGSINDTQSITTCSIKSETICAINPLRPDFGQYYSISYTTNSITIHINTVNRTRDSGQWKCLVYSSGENTDTKIIDVKVPVSSVEITNKNIDLIKDSTVNLECIATGGYPLPNITWSIDTRLMTSSVNRTTSSLSYQPVLLDHGQMMQCLATNGYGPSQTDSFQLNITYKPVVDITPSITPYKLIQGHTVLLECQVNQSNPVVTSYKWFNGNNIIPGSSSTYTVSNDGSYSCSATNSVGESDRSRVISVEILYPPTVSTPKSPYSIIELNTLTLTCNATTYPVANSYTWSGPNNNLLQFEQNLTIPSINKDQAGQYTCTVTNIIQITGGQHTVTGNSSTTVNVLYGPVVSVSSVETKIKENENLRINCTVTSNPPTNNIVWYKSNGDIVSNQFVVNGINRRDLVINDINRSKSNNYTCTARLDLQPTVGDIVPQTHSQSSSINVQYFDDIVITTNQTELKENDAVFITCSVESNPPASIKWFKDGDGKLPTSNSDIYVKSSTSCLDTGNYSCLATNPIYTNQKTKSIELFVHCSPRLDSREDQKLSGVIGETIELKANIISYPGADFQWFYKDNGGDILIGNQEPYLVLNNKRFINSFRSVLRINITSNEMYRQYYLNVTNDDGLSNIVQFQLISETVPDRPHNISFRNKTSDTICVEWTPGFNGGALQSFIVQHSTDDKTWVNSSPIPDDTNNGRVDYCIEGLEPDTSYYIRVIASNKYGESQIGTLSQSKPPKTAQRQDPGDIPGNEFDVEGLGIGIGIVLAILAAVVVGVFIYKFRKGKVKEEQTYDSFDPRTRADISQTYQELNTVRNTETPQVSDAAQYYNLRADQNRTDREDTRPYANI